MKKVLVFNDYYHPAKKTGGPITSIHNAAEALKENFEFYIEAVNHDFGDKTPFEGIGEGWYEVGSAKVRYHHDGELDFNYKKIEEFIKEVNPDLMWFSGLLLPHKLHNAIRIGEKMGIPVLISPRGEASPDRMVLKGYKKFPYALLCTLMGIYNKKNVYFHATSDDEIVGLQKYFHIRRDRIFEVPNIGVVQRPRSTEYCKHKDSLRIMFISRIHKIKNVHIAIDIVNKLNCDAVFDIYGPIETPEYWKICEEKMKESPANVKVRYCGQVNPMDVSNVFSQYDCFLFPTANENYGHVIAESLANGCPVVLSKGTTPWDDLDGNAGYVCELSDTEQFVKALSKIADMDNDAYRALVENTEKYYFKKTEDSDCVEGHKKMFVKVIGE